MERRSFLKALTGVIGGIALEQAVPLGRVWSFPKKIIIPAPVACQLLTLDEIRSRYLKPAMDALWNECVVTELQAQHDLQFYEGNTFLD